jgi:2-methylisocitrate lyase-like PEP mutase family enzyme
MADLEAAGVRRVSIGSGLTKVALTAFFNAAKELKEHRTFTFAKSGLSFADINNFMAGK